MASFEYLIDCDFSISYGPLDDRMNGLYVPALSRSIRYDRVIGSFSPDALAFAGRGVDALIRNRGHMRLLVNAGLTDEEMTHVREGRGMTDFLKEKFLAQLDAADSRTSQRLEVLGRLAAEKILDVRIILPEQISRPHNKAGVRGNHTQPSMGIFTDAEGNQLCFYGSVDESLYTGDQNYEQLLVYKSWEPGAQYLHVIRQYFERLWGGKEPGWRSLILPEAVTNRMIQFRRGKIPAHDRPGDVFSGKSDLDGDIREMIVSQFLRDIPNFPRNDAKQSRDESPQKEGNPLTDQTALENPESCGLPLLRWEADLPDPVVVYYHLKTDQARPLESVAELEKVFDERIMADGPPVISEIKAREHFYALLKSREDVRGKSLTKALQQEVQGLANAVCRVLVKAALCDVARSRHATLFDEDLLNAGFDAATISRQKKKGFPFSELMSLLNSEEKLKLSPEDPFFHEVEDKPKEKIQAIEAKLKEEGRDLIKKWVALKDKRPLEQIHPLLTVQKYFMTVKKERPRLILLVAPPRGERFTRYLPFYTLDTIADKLVRGGNVREEGWMEVGIGKKLNKSMFVVRIEGRAMEPLISEGHFSVFESDIKGSVDGAILIVHGKDIYDPDSNGHLVIRRLRSIDTSAETGNYREIILEALHPDYQPLHLKDIDKNDFKIIGRYISGV